ncbi:hypothetical protein LTR09_009705 [Extremus antarcticus]|uniref:Peptidase S8/S53 domain-containing protein n=1 Tax=Extremus antarcticus TaxID=702011 RepID=A0AAJ0D8U0_9PEZI|nr:hypothetical protein LTR09_009705 [Extremus antarcticus]
MSATAGLAALALAAPLVLANPWALPAQSSNKASSSSTSSLARSFSSVSNSSIASTSSISGLPTVIPGSSTASGSSVSITGGSISAAPSSSSTGFPFTTPTSTSTVGFGVSFPSAASSATAALGFVATNPANPQQTIGFTKGTVPAEDRNELPDVTDAAPGALLLLGFRLPVLLFPAFEIIAPFGTAAALTAAAVWLTFDLFPDPKELAGGGDGNQPDPTTKANDPDPTSSKSSDGSASTSALPSTSSSAILSSSSSESASSSSSSGVPVATPLYVLMTKPGTSSSDFQNLIQGLPDEGKGVQITYPNLDWQGYVTELNDTFAATVGQMSIIEAITLDAPEAETGVVDKRGLESLLAHDYAAMPVPRQVNAGPPPPTNNLVRQTGSQQALKVLSQGRANNLAGTLEDYLFDDTAAGDGITIYMLDSGFLQGSTDFDFESDDWEPDVDYHVVSPDIINPLPGGGVPSGLASLRETVNHGTCAASMAVGTTWGVAKKARLVPVKFKSEAATRPGALMDAFAWAISDVISNDREGKAIINLSFGFETDAKNLNIPDPMMQTMLQDAWDAGIVTIVAAGNDGGTTAKATPQRLGTTDNGLITVGGIQNDGSIWPQSVRQGTRGSLTISAVSAALTCASNQDVSGTQQRDGTTFAAPQVAGLVAYFMSIPSLYSQFSAGGAKGVPAAVKKYLTDVGYSRAAGGPLAAYNQAEDAICLAEAGGNNKRTLQARDDPTLQPILSDGTIVASDVNIPCKATTAQSATSASGSTSASAGNSTASQTSPISQPSSSRFVTLPSTSSVTTTQPVASTTVTPGHASSTTVPPPPPSSAAPPPPTSTSVAPPPPTTTPPPESSSFPASSSFFFSSSSFAFF